MSETKKVVTRRSKRLGRGYGSGKGGHTSSRGQKGQGARRNLHILFEGGKFKKSYYKRLPLRRGKGKFKSSSNPIIVKLAYLEVYKSGSVVDINSLVANGVVKKSDADTFGVKILGNGEISKKLTIAVPISKSAAEKVVKVGGKIDNKETGVEKKKKVVIPKNVKKDK